MYTFTKYCYKILDETQTGQYVQAKKPITKCKDSNRITRYCIPRGKKDTLSVDECRDYFESLETLNFNDFDVMMREIQKIRVVTFDNADWTKSSCTCQLYAKNNKCSHVMYVAVARKHYILRPEAMTVKLGQIRGRGRPKKVPKRKALVRDNEERVEEEFDQEDEIENADDSDISDAEFDDEIADADEIDVDGENANAGDAEDNQEVLEEDN